MTTGFTPTVPGEVRSGRLEEVAQDDLHRSQAFLAKLQAMDSPDSPPPEPAQSAGFQASRQEFETSQQGFGGTPFDRSQPIGQPTGQPSPPPANAMQNGHLQDAQHHEIADDIAAALAFSRRRASEIPEFQPEEPQVGQYQQSFQSSAPQIRTDGNASSSAGRGFEQEARGRVGDVGVLGDRMGGPTGRTGSPTARNPSPISTGPVPGFYDSGLGRSASPRGSPTGRPASRVGPGGMGSPRISSPAARAPISPPAFARDTNFGSDTHFSSNAGQQPSGGFPDSAWDAPPASKAAGAVQPSFTEDTHFGSGSAVGQQAPSSMGGFADGAFDPPVAGRAAAPASAHGFSDGAFDAPVASRSAGPPVAAAAAPQRYTPALEFDDDSEEDEDDDLAFGGLMGKLAKRPPATSQAPSSASPKPASQAPSTFGMNFDDAFGGTGGFGSSAFPTERSPGVTLPTPPVVVVSETVTITKVEPPKQMPTGVTSLSAKDLELMGKPSNRFPTYTPPVEEAPSESPSSNEDAWGFGSSAFGAKSSAATSSSVAAPPKPADAGLSMGSRSALSPPAMGASGLAAPPSGAPTSGGPMKPMKPKTSGPTASLVVSLPLHASNISTCMQAQTLALACWFLQQPDMSFIASSPSLTRVVPTARLVPLDTIAALRKGAPSMSPDLPKMTPSVRLSQRNLPIHSGQFNARS